MAAFDDPCGQGQYLSLDQAGGGAQAVDLCDLVPQRTVAIEPLGDGLQRIALLDGIAAPPHCPG